jgi:diguanylate cyclase (GGDEF)-like protein
MSTVATTSITNLPLWALLTISALCGAAIAGGGALILARMLKRQSALRIRGDQVTGVADRRAFVQRLGADWEAARSGGSRFGLLVVNVDAFGDINEIYGRAAGDQVLAEVAERIRMRVRRDDFVARVDADEFVVICADVGPEGLEVVRRNLEAYVNFSASVPVTLSIGFAAPAEDDRSSLEVLDRARASLGMRRAEQPERIVNDALSALLTPR